jgi:hypothetical protein
MRNLLIISIDLDGMKTRIHRRGKKSLDNPATRDAAFNSKLREVVERSAARRTTVDNNEATGDMSPAVVEGIQGIGDSLRRSARPPKLDASGHTTS